MGYSDSQGLGAENIKLADDGAGVDDTPPASTQLKAKTKASSVKADADSMVLKAKPKMSADAGAASVLKAKPKMSAGSTMKSTGTVTIPGHLTPQLAERLVAWMWDKGG